MIHAYSEDYLNHSQRNMGHMLDFAVNTCDIYADEFMNMFIVSGIAEQFEKGNPLYIAGMNGCELVRETVRKVTGKEILKQDDMYLDKSPEYWAGWALCYYQWCSCRSFKNIINAVSVDTVIGMYYTLHEADISKFVNIMNNYMCSFYTETALARQRKNIGMTQNELAEISGVNLRIIQNYEQKKNDINSAKVSTLFNLSRALNCKIEDLIEF